MSVIREFIVRLRFLLSRQSAVGYCTVCRKPIYEPFANHWDRVRHYE